jgi:hypothetical protein
VTVLAPDEQGTRSDQVDWLELTVLCRDSGVISSADVLRVLGMSEEEPEHGTTTLDEDTGEMLEDEILEPRAEVLIARLWAELDYRAQTLGAAYPFELTPAGEGFVVRVRAHAGGPTDPAVQSAWRSYIACLLITGMRRSVIQRREQQPAVSATARQSARVLQILSVLAAAHHVGGDAYWFGSPRVDGTTKYRDALERLVALLGHGRLKREEPATSTGQEKDGSIDVVAWKSFPDRTYGSVVLYGQVASGKNWRGKPIGTFIDALFHEWFEDIPSKNWLPALFMPFTLHAEADTRRARTFDEVALALARQDEKTYGAVFDRLRITAANFTDETECLVSSPEHLHSYDTLMTEVDGWIADATVHACQD